MAVSFFETTTRVVSLAVRIVDDMTSSLVSGAEVILSNDRYSKKAVGKTDGFYVFADIEPGTYSLSIAATDYEFFDQGIDVPLPGSVVLDIPGENEVMLSVVSSDTATETIEFAAKQFFTPVNVGTTAISSKRISSLAATLEGEAVTTATLDEVGSGANRIEPEDVLRLVGERLIRLRPAPHYRFENHIRRLSGSVRDASTGHPIDGAIIELSRIGTDSINSEDVGTTPENTVRVHTVGSGAIAKRVLGLNRDIQKRANFRGQFVFYFPQRPDLDFDQVTVIARATDYAVVPPVDVDLTNRNNNIENFNLSRV